MVAFFSTLLRIFFHAFRSKRTILSENALLKKENEILLRRLGKKKAHFSFYDRLFVVVAQKEETVCGARDSRIIRGGNYAERMREQTE
jgi:hypothetical protein